MASRRGRLKRRTVGQGLGGVVRDLNVCPLTSIAGGQERASRNAANIIVETNTKAHTRPRQRPDKVLGPVYPNIA